MTSGLQREAGPLLGLRQSTEDLKGSENFHKEGASNPVQRPKIIVGNGEPAPDDEPGWKSPPLSPKKGVQQPLLSPAAESGTIVKSSASSGTLVKSSARSGTLSKCSPSTKSGWLGSSCCLAVASGWKKFVALTLSLRQRFSSGLLALARNDHQQGDLPPSKAASPDYLGAGSAVPSPKKPGLQPASPKTPDIHVHSPRTPGTHMASPRNSNARLRRDDGDSIREHFQSMRKSELDEPPDVNQFSDLEDYVTHQLYKVASDASNLSLYKATSDASNLSLDN